MKRTALAIVLVASTLLVVLVGVVIFHMYGATNYGPGPVAIEATTDKSFYLQGEDVQFSIYVSNEQNWPVPVPDIAYYRITEDAHVLSDIAMNADFPPDQLPTYPSHSRTFHYSYVWNSVSASPGNCTLFVNFSGLVDYGGGGNCTFEIR